MQIGPVTGEGLQKLFGGESGMCLEEFLHVRFASPEVAGELTEARLRLLVLDQIVQGFGNHVVG